ncbi:MAG TPA: DUF2141 domain-containing protein [Eudoraea sp.]|nr:DUF2141 domain-containing protein [Eudoraea sp.]
MKQIVFLILIIPMGSFAQHSLSVTVEGVHTSEGKVNIALYNSAEGFLKFDQAYKSDSTEAIKGITYFKMYDLPNGEYALAVFHDANNNGQLDANWLGIPKEAMGFSNARMKTFGPPSFKECTIDLHKDRQVSVIIE